MTRRQAQIPGTEIAGTTEATENPEIRAAAEAVRIAKRTAKNARGDLLVKKIELAALLRANKIAAYRYDDEDGVEQEAYVGEKPVIDVRETGERSSEIGEGLDGSDDDDGIGAGVTPVAAVHEGLIAQALKSQEDAGVTETEDGDVAVAEKSTSNGKRKRGGGRKKARS